MPHCTPQVWIPHGNWIKHIDTEVGRKGRTLPSAVSPSTICVYRTAFIHSFVRSVSQSVSHSLTQSIILSFIAIFTEPGMCPKNTMKNPSKPPVQKGAPDIASNLTHLRGCQLGSEKSTILWKHVTKETAYSGGSQRRLPGGSDQVEI